MVTPLHVKLFLLTGFKTEEGQWYKFTVKGTPLESDGEIIWHDHWNPQQKPAKCRTEYLVEGPGIMGSTGKYSYSIDSSCLDMERKTGWRGQERYPLKVFAAKQVSWAKPLDGVVRNIVFENTATETSIDTTCS